ncbi:MAG: hypothetical protein ACOX9C_05840, partial [Kiritimatiellia bacterium]
HPAPHGATTNLAAIQRLTAPLQTSPPSSASRRHYKPRRHPAPHGATTNLAAIQRLGAGEWRASRRF